MFLFVGSVTTKVNTNLRQSTSEKKVGFRKLSNLEHVISEKFCYINYDVFFAPLGLNLCNNFNMKIISMFLEYYKELLRLEIQGGINLDLLLIISP